VETDDIRIADRLLIRAVIDAYASRADRKDHVGQAATFTEDGRVRLYLADPSGAHPIDSISGRENLEMTFATLIEQYENTTYLNGQSTVDFESDRLASAETYCMAFHILQDGDQRMLVTMAIRYLDQLVKDSEGWLIADRQLIFDWTDRRPSAP
jgi:hypothetical protein